MKVVVAQLGARMNYAVARSLHRAGRLAALYTDFGLSGKWSGELEAISGWSTGAQRLVRRLAGRVVSEISRPTLKTFNGFGFHYWLRLRKARTSQQRMQAYLWGGSRFGKYILRRELPDCTAIYAYNSAALELLQYAASTGIRGIVEQTIAPKIVEYSLLTAERERWLGDRPRGIPEEVIALAEREREEWRAAETVVCGSEFVRQCIENVAPASGKVVVVPYGVPYEATQLGPTLSGGKLRVLFAGWVGLRKGLPYALAALNSNSVRDVELRVVGPVEDELVLRLPGAQRAEFFGPVARSEMRQHFKWADVLIIPSLCEGSATVSYEALASGKPVIATPNAGTIITNGVDGFIVPICDAAAIRDKLEVLICDRKLLSDMKEAALQTASLYTVEAYGRRLLEGVFAGYC